MEEYQNIMWPAIRRMDTRCSNVLMLCKIDKADRWTFLLRSAYYSREREGTEVLAE